MACDDGWLHLWDVPSGRAHPPIHIDNDEQAGLGDLFFSPDGRLVALRGRVWDVATGAPWSQVEGRQVKFSPDGHWLSSLDEDGNLRLFPRFAPPQPRSLEERTGRRIMPNGEVVWTDDSP